MIAILTGLLLALQSARPVPLPVESPIGGPFWSYVVPATLLISSTLATLALYRHFSRKGPAGGDDGKRN